ncbi:MAG: pyruvate kinase [Thermoplasmata archaeon]|nr:pyruvate kinase [Thermoplasmata archaeon]
MRRTKILATLGPASASAKIARQLVRAGADGFRINCSHGDSADHRSLIALGRSAGEAGGRTVFLVADLQGPKMRLGAIAPSPIQLRTGQSWTLDDRRTVGGATRALAEVPHLREAANPGDPVLLGDGGVELRVTSVGVAGVATRVVSGGPVSSHAGVFLPRAKIRTAVLSPKDRADLAMAIEEKVDYVALSFVRSGRDLEIAQRAARRFAGSSGPAWIAKIERGEALREIDGILAHTDAIMVARGDLGIEVPLERLALEQKRLILKARRACVPAIVATQMLLSMVTTSRPTRAEATDVANAVLDGADAVMLSEESAVGAHPVEAVGWLNRIARVTEADGIPDFPHPPIAPSSTLASPERAVADAALRLARDLSARMIVTPTHSGRTARMVSGGRPRMPIVAISNHAEVRRRLALVWGVIPHNVPDHLDLSGLRDYAARELSRLKGIAGEGPIVLTAGYPVEGRPTNLVTVVEPEGARPSLRSG